MTMTGAQTARGRENPRFLSLHCIDERGHNAREREGYSMSKKEILNKLDEIMDGTRVNELLGKKHEEEKECNKVLWIFAVIGAVAAVAAIAYAVYRCLTPDYLEEFEDNFDDDFDDDFFEDEDEDEETGE